MLNLYYTPRGKNIAAHGARVVIVFANQILLVPFFLICWGKDLYGDWIVLMAISQFFNLSDLGLNSVTNNMICTTPYNSSKDRFYSSLLINNFVFIAIVGSVLVILLLLICHFFEIENLLGLRIIKGQDAIYISLLLVIQVVLTMMNKILDPLYNVSHKAHIATIINDFLLLLTTITIFIAVLLKWSMILLCVIISVLPAFSLCYKFVDTKRYVNLKYSFSDLDVSLLKNMFLPSLMYMTFPIGNSMIFQGYSIIINKYMGAVSLISFNTTRTMVNFVRSVIEVVSQGSRPEFSIAYGNKDVLGKRKIYNSVVTLSLKIYVCISVFLLCFGNFIYQLWTKGNIQFDFTLMLIFIIVIFFSTLWNSQSVTMLSTNRHAKLGLIFLHSCFFSILACYLSVYYTHNLYFCAMSIIVSDLPLVFYATMQSRIIINQK